MTEFDDFWQRQRKHLADDYSDDIGVVNCDLLAKDAAKLLKAEGKIPLILDLRGIVRDNAGNRKTLVPLVYEGLIEWGGHLISGTTRKLNYTIGMGLLLGPSPAAMFTHSLSINFSQPIYIVASLLITMQWSPLRKTLYCRKT